MSAQFERKNTERRYNKPEGENQRRYNKPEGEKSFDKNKRYSKPEGEKSFDKNKRFQKSNEQGKESRKYNPGERFGFGPKTHEDSKIFILLSKEEQKVRPSVGRDYRSLNNITNSLRKPYIFLEDKGLEGFDTKAIIAYITEDNFEKIIEAEAMFAIKKRISSNDEMLKHILKFVHRIG